MKSVLVAMMAVLAVNGCGKLRGPKGESGTDGSPGAAGSKGDKGDTGERGTDGRNGTSCTVLPINGGSRIICDDGTSSDVMNGTEVETIQLCPNLTGGPFHEYLLRIDGQLYGVYASQPSIGLSRIWPGSWRTTDGRNCNFTVNSNLEVL